MKKKIILFGAALAALATFTSCSSEDDLTVVEPQQPVIEKKLVPFSVGAEVNETRGTNVTSLTSFTMYSTMIEAMATGALFQYEDDVWGVSNQSLSWPEYDTNEEAPVYRFMALNDAAHFANYANSHTLFPKPWADMADKTTINATPSFTYAIPTTYADQVDLLVADTTGSATLGAPAGSVKLKFHHALSQIKAIKVYCNIDKVTNSGDKVNYRFRINGIRLGGLHNIGTYTFGAATPWSNQSGEEVFEVPLTAASLTFGNAGFQPGAKSNAITLPLTDDGLYLIPQTAAGAIASVGSSYEVNNAYAELDAQVFFYSDYVNTPEFGGAYRVGEGLYNGFDWDQTSSDAVGFGKIRVPLKFTIQPGKGYTLLLDISKGVIYENEGATTETSALGESIFEGATITVG